MAYVCPHCGMYSQNHVDREQNMNCEYCEIKTQTKILPLFVVAGTSGAGKTSVLPELVKQLPECVVFDKDLLLGHATHGLEQFYDAWLLIAHSIAQGGRHTVICGTIMPWDLDNCPNRDLVGTIHFLNLHCNDEVREQRLKARPAWRKSSSDEAIEEHR